MDKPFRRKLVNPRRLIANYSEHGVKVEIRYLMCHCILVKLALRTVVVISENLYLDLFMSILLYQLLVRKKIHQDSNFLLRIMPVGLNISSKLTF
jgi:hypothetical protein